MPRIKNKLLQFLNLHMCPTCNKRLSLFISPRKSFYLGDFKRRAIKCPRCGKFCYGKTNWKNAIWCYPIALFLMLFLTMIFGVPAAEFLSHFRNEGLLFDGILIVGLFIIMFVAFFIPSLILIKGIVLVPIDGKEIPDNPFGLFRSLLLFIPFLIFSIWAYNTPFWNEIYLEIIFIFLLFLIWFLSL